MINNTISPNYRAFNNFNNNLAQFNTNQNAIQGVANENMTPIRIPAPTLQNPTTQYLEANYQEADPQALKAQTLALFEAQKKLKL